MIGIFDSGSGGLSVLNALKKRAPTAEVVYFGDIANAPYGNRSREELGVLTVLGIQKLLDEGAQDIVSACNSVSVHIVEPLFAQLQQQPRQVIEMVGPTLAVLRQKKEEHLLLVATRATIDSGMYQQGLEAAGSAVIAVAIPDLAGQIEREESLEALADTVRNALADIDLKSITTVVLACTHFPLAKGVFEMVGNERGSRATFFDPAEAVAEQVVRTCDTGGNGSIRFLISQDSETFRKRVEPMGREFPFSIQVLC